MLTLLVLVPCIGTCGLTAAGAVVSHRIAKDRKAAAAPFIAEVEAKGPAGATPPEHFTFRPQADGGYALYFAEPAFFLPTDFFYVWDRGEKQWDLLEAGQLPRETD